MIECKAAQKHGRRICGEPLFVSDDELEPTGRILLRLSEVRPNCFGVRCVKCGKVTELQRRRSREAA